MDQSTQQNAALVEQMAAAASSLKGQASDLVQVVSVFKISAEQQSHVPPKANVRSGKVQHFDGPDRRDAPAKPSATYKPSPKPAARPAPLAKPTSAVKTALMAPKVSAKKTPAGGDDDWESF